MKNNFPTLNDFKGTNVMNAFSMPPLFKEKRTKSKDNSTNIDKDEHGEIESEEEFENIESAKDQYGNLIKSMHGKHKYLKIENGKYIYDHFKMTSKDHHKVSEEHNDKRQLLQEHGGDKDKLEMHSKLAKEHEDIAYKKEGEERKKIKKDKEVHDDGKYNDKLVKNSNKQILSGSIDKLKKLEKFLNSNFEVKTEIINNKLIVKHDYGADELRDILNNEEDYQDISIEKSEDHTQHKVHKVMKEFKEGKLHSGSKEGEKVTDRKQAIAIAMSEAGLSKSANYNDDEYNKHKHVFDAVEKAMSTGNAPGKETLEPGVGKKESYLESTKDKYNDSHNSINKGGDFTGWDAKRHRDEMVKHQEKSYKYKKEGNKDKAYEHEQSALQHKGLMRDKMKTPAEKGMIQKSEAFDTLIGDNFEEKLEKAEFSTKQREKLSKEHEAESNGSYPIRNESDLKNAIKAFGRSKDKAKTKAWIEKRAKELGAEKHLPAKWEE